MNDTNWIYDAPDTAKIWRVGVVEHLCRGFMKDKGEVWGELLIPRLSIEPGKSIKAIRQDCAKQMEQPIEEIRIKVWAG